MNNLNELKDIWLTAPTAQLPDATHMAQMIKTFRNRKLRSKWRLICYALAAAGGFITLIVSLPTAMISTYVGAAFIIIACLILAATNIRSLQRFYEPDDNSNQQFLRFLKQTRHNQVRYYRKTQVAGLGFCSAGLLLYMYEFVRNNSWILTGMYALLVIYLLVLWLVVRPRMFKKGTAKLNSMIERIEKINKQF